MVESIPHATNPKGTFLKWILGERGAQWGTDPGEYTASLVEETVSRMGRLFGPGRYFGLEIQGWHNIPQSPALLISNHSGGTSIPDVWGLLIGWYRHFGTQRPVHPLAHEIILSTTTTGRFFSKRGVLKAHPGVAADVLTNFKRDLLVMPGGDLDTWRPYSERYTVRFGGRSGYAKLALRSGVECIPVANAGAHQTLMVLTDGRKIARAMGLYEVARAEIFPVHLSLPWGLGIGPLPHLPTPVTLRYKIGKPVAFPTDFVVGSEPTEAQVQHYGERVQAAVQAQLDQLRDEAEERRVRKATARLATSVGRRGWGIDLPALSYALVDSMRSAISERFFG